MSHDPKDADLIARMGADPKLQQTTRDWFDRACDYRYTYNFKWLGRPIIQFPLQTIESQSRLLMLAAMALVAVLLKKRAHQGFVGR